MSDLMAVWIVSGAEGQYSDYSTWCVAAYTDKDEADRHAKLMNDREAEIKATAEADKDYSDPRCAMSVHGPEHSPGGKYHNDFAGCPSSGDADYTVEAIPLFPAVPENFVKSKAVLMDYLEEEGLIPP